MDPRDEIDPEQHKSLERVFAEQLVACLQECERGRRGLFSDLELMGECEQNRLWTEAAQLRQLAVALQGILNQAGQRSALCDEFLDLCTMHGENHPGEARLARLFLARIEHGEVGTPTEPEFKPW